MVRVLCDFGKRFTRVIGVGTPRRNRRIRTRPRTTTSFVTRRAILPEALPRWLTDRSASMVLCRTATA